MLRTIVSFLLLAAVAAEVGDMEAEFAAAEAAEDAAKEAEEANFAAEDARDAADEESASSVSLEESGEEALLQIAETGTPHNMDKAVSEMNSIKDMLLEIWSGFSEVEAKAAPSWKGNMATKITALKTAMTATLTAVQALKTGVDLTSTTTTTTRYSLAYHLKALASPTPAPALVQSGEESVTPGTDLDTAVSELHSIKDKLLEVWSGFSEVEAKTPAAWKNVQASVGAGNPVYDVATLVNTVAAKMALTLTAVTDLKTYVDNTSTTTTTTRYSLAYHLKALAAPTPAPR